MQSIRGGLRFWRLHPSRKARTPTQASKLSTPKQGLGFRGLGFREILSMSVLL